MGGKHVGACSNIACLILDMVVALLRGTRSAFVMMACSVHLDPDWIFASKSRNMSSSASLMPCFAFISMYTRHNLAEIEPTA